MLNRFAFQDALFRTTAAVLHLGNIELAPAANESCEVKNRNVLHTVAELLTVPSAKLEEVRKHCRATRSFVSYTVLCRPSPCVTMRFVESAFACLSTLTRPQTPEMPWPRLCTATSSLGSSSVSTRPSWVREKKKKETVVN